MFDPQIIANYENDADKISRLIKDLTREDLFAIPTPGKWSIQEVVLHLADSEQVFADRIKRVIAEDDAKLLAFDENKWSANLHYNDQSAQDAAKLIELTRKQIARILHKLPPAAFDRTGTHSQAGPLTLAAIIQKATMHLEHHLNFIVAKRENWGR